MTQPAKAQEPSMEEILASIRRIIADDDTAKSPPKPAEAEKKPAASPVKPVPPAPAARPAVAAAPAPEALPATQADIDALLADLNAGPKEEPAPEDVLDLTESMQASATATPSFKTIDAQPDLEFQEAPPPPPEPASRKDVSRVVPAADGGAGLLSSSTSAAVDSAFNTLAQTVLIQNARTLEDLVREMLRPMLKSWLDDNLPSLVERLVRAEIERVSRGRN